MSCSWIGRRMSSRFGRSITVPRNCSGLSSSHDGTPRPAGRFDGLADLVVLAALLANLNGIALADLVGRDVDLLSVHLDVSVTDELTRLRARGGESERVDDVVEPQLELAEQVVAGDAGLAARRAGSRAGTAARAGRRCASPSASREAADRSRGPWNGGGRAGRARSCGARWRTCP